MSQIKFLGTILNFGSTRIVWILPKFGIVIKLARIKFVYLFHTLENICFLIFKSKTGNGRAIVKKMFAQNVTSSQSPWFGLVCGIYENWCEFTFFCANRKQKFLVPTYFSIFGFINFMKYCHDLPFKEGGSVFRICPYYSLSEMTDGTVRQDGHHFQNESNFGVMGDRICMRDYGGKMTRKILSEYFPKFDTLRVNNLKPGPTWK